MTKRSLERKETEADHSVDMERLAHRIVELEKQLSFEQSQKTKQLRVTQERNHALAGGKDSEGNPIPMQTPSHSRSSTRSFDFTNDMETLKLRKQSQSFDTILTPSLRDKSMDEKSRHTSFTHLAAQNERLKQKLKDLESRLRQVTSDANRIPETSDSVTLSSVEISGLKVFIRTQSDRTELYKVQHIGKESHGEYFHAHFVDDSCN